MVTWCRDLYVDEELLPCKKDILIKIEQGFPLKGIYIVSLASNDSNLFDIINANEIARPFYKKQDVKVVAISKGKEQATRLVACMIEDMYEKNGKIKPKEYFYFS